MPSKGIPLLRNKLILKGARTLVRQRALEFAEISQDEAIAKARLTFEELPWPEQVALVLDWLRVMPNPDEAQEEEQQPQAHPAESTWGGSLILAAR